MMDENRLDNIVECSYNMDNKPIEYVAMALSGEMQSYCDIEDEMVKGMFGTIVQGYLKKGYNRDTAEMMAREFFRYES